MINTEEFGSLSLPPLDAKLEERDGKLFIYDGLRQRYVALTPEEWVRQHFVNHLIAHLGYPKQLLANEVFIRIGQKSLRCDTILYYRNLKPLAVMEYKAPGIPLSAKVIDQAAAYNYSLQARYLFLSNGQDHLCLMADIESRQLEPLESIPPYSDLTGGKDLK